MKGSNRYRRLARTALRAAFLALFALFIRQQLSALEIHRVLELLREAGWMVLLVLVPASLLTLADTAGWGACITGAAGVRLRRLVTIRLGCDAVCNSLPAGIAPGEALRTLLLRERCGLGLTEGAASCLLGKVNMALAHMAFICIVMLLLALGAGGAVRIDLLPGGSAGLVGEATVAGALLVALIQPYTGPRLSQLLRVLERIRWGQIRRVTEKLGPHISRIDTQVRAFARQHPAQLRRSLAWFFAGWIALGSESTVILFLLGAHVSPLSGFVLEAVVSVLRILFFFLPSALGAAEVAYITILAALGVPDPLTLSAGFIAIKRSREALWVLLGYAVLTKSLSVLRRLRFPALVPSQS